MNERIKSIIKNEYFIVLVITIIAFLIRMLNIDKTYGLWNDEILCYTIADKGLPFGIMKTLLKMDYHMPLYYYYLGVWMHIFGNSDIALRLSSVVCGALTVPAFYYMGRCFNKERKSLGYFLAFIACFNPVMVYYSQEVRFYSMLALFSALSVAFMLKLLNKPSLKDYCLLGLSNLVILYIYTLGGLFVCLQWFILFLVYITEKRETIKGFLRYSGIFFILSIPYIVLFSIYAIQNSQQLVSSFSWGVPPIFEPFPLFNDWFSPFLSDLKSGIGYYKFSYLKKEDQLFMYIIFLNIPTLCFSIGLIKSFIAKNKKILYLTFIAVFFMLFEVLRWSQGEFHILTRYTFIFLPIILLLGANGIIEIKNKYFKWLLIGIIGIVYIFNVCNYKKADSFKCREDGFRYPSMMIRNFSSSGDYILSTKFAGEYFTKYIPEYNTIEINTSKMFTMDKTKKMALNIFSNDFVYSMTKSNSLNQFAYFASSSNPTKNFEKYLNREVNRVPKGKNIIFINGPSGVVRFD